MSLYNLKAKIMIRRIAIYFSGISGALLLVIRAIGEIADFHYNRLFFILGVVLLLLVYLPLVIVDKYLQNKKLDSIIASYKNGGNANEKIEKGDSKHTGWGMNSSPFRERKSGLTWGGGNIKGSNATRGNRRTFLK